MNRFIKTLNLKNKSEKYECIYNKLLSGDYVAEVTIDTSRPDSSYKDLHSIDVEFEHNDCCLSSWSLNFYCRTPKAVKSERYKTLGSALSSLKKLAKKHNIKLVSNLRVYNRSNNYLYDRTHLFNIEL